MDRSDDRNDGGWQEGRELGHDGKMCECTPLQALMNAYTSIWRRGGPGR